MEKHPKTNGFSKLAPLLGTVLVHAFLLLVLAVNLRHIKDLFPHNPINEVIEFIEFQELASGYESVIPQPPAPLVPLEPELKPVIEEMMETEEILPVNTDLPEDFTAEIPVTEEAGTDSVHVLEVTNSGGLGGYGEGMQGISNYKLPTFLGQDYNYFHIWFQEQFKYPAEMKDRTVKKVLVVFMVDKEGNVSQVGVRNCPNELLTEEIRRVMRSSPRWSPAQRGGKNTNHYFQLPVNIN